MLWRALYALATWALFPFVLGYFAWRGRAEPGYRRHWRERLGLWPRRADRPIWIHAASVGEVGMAASLIGALRRAGVSTPLLLTTMTPTGRDAARRALGEHIAIGYVPLDTHGAPHRFLRRVRPRLGVLIETELWPHLVAAATTADVPLVMVNAAVSARSARRFAHGPAARAIRWMLTRLSLILAASAEDAAQLRALGAPSGNVVVAGNVKYDLTLPVGLAQAANRERVEWSATDRPIWVAASTHEGEEELLVEIFSTLRASFPGLLLVLVPRHPQRFDIVADRLACSGYRIARRSAGACVDAETDILLADTLGEMLRFYALADIVFVGGSLVAGIGGHNVIEPAALGRVFATGPYVREWQAVIDHLAPEGACVTADVEALCDRLSTWLADPLAAQAAGADNAARVRRHRGALSIAAAKIAAVLTTVDKVNPRRY